MTNATILLGHGTQDADGVAEFLQYAHAIAAGSGDQVFTGVLEYPTPEAPPIQDAFDRAAESGHRDVVLLPALLHFAGHSRSDVPEVLAQARQRHPDINVHVAGPLGYGEQLLQAAEARLAGFPATEDDAVLIVGRGSFDTEANADLFRAARVLWDRNAYGWVEAGFVSLSPPDVASGIERCRRLGARHVTVLPYFLNTGVLVKRIGDQARACGAGVSVAPHLGLHSLVIDVLLERQRQARAGSCPCQAGSACRLPELGCTQSPGPRLNSLRASALK